MLLTTLSLVRSMEYDASGSLSMPILCKKLVHGLRDGGSQRKALPDLQRHVALVECHHSLLLGLAVPDETRDGHQGHHVGIVRRLRIVDILQGDKHGDIQMDTAHSQVGIERDLQVDVDARSMEEVVLDRVAEVQHRRLGAIDCQPGVRVGARGRRGCSLECSTCGNSAGC